MMREAAKTCKAELLEVIKSGLTENRSVRDHAGMKNNKLEHRPGELFIDRYMPNASEEAREEAFANLRSLVALLVRIDERLALEDRERHDSPEL
jgi:hypothetical protein